MAVISSWDHNKDFIKLNPQFNVGVIEKFYNESKSKKSASDILWAIAYCYCKESIIFSWTLENKLKWVASDIIKDPKVNILRDNKDIIDFFESIYDTPALRQLKIWNEKMDEKTKFLSSLKYNIGTFENIEKMLSSNVKLYSELERIQLSLEKEGGDMKTKGNWEESLSEKEII